ncbi:hypothetical protein AAZX31_14G035900 [Glycine max]|uniref:RING-H2 finger protein ATL39 n=1 Tax=Glycine max TaxID=3847 RepID=UPI00023D3C7B|nr:RING-H2 finger protein ATL39 [Glycine max]KAG4953086.1 hypothetical protein JHK87_038680 [Glycine soja]KAH1092968.1 hypothetical protein GYH30_038945 [Glycine max]KAH1211620.1 E3 ubiquitin-protein ligase ATL31 [Glycine max]|eukprot:XP_006596599.1 RING-H2 finger protein ATL39 [Glycine max]
MGLSESLNLHDENSKAAAGVSAAMSLILGGIFVFIVCYYVCIRLRSQTHRDVPAAAAVAAVSDQETVEKCPVFVYSTVKKENVAAEECAVCLGEFEDCDVVKMLPKCEHIFHQHCIDAWLPSHMNCPICRQKVTFDNNVSREEQEEEVLGTESEVAGTTAEPETVVGPEEDVGQQHSESEVLA